MWNCPFERPDTIRLSTGPSCCWLRNYGFWPSLLFFSAMESGVTTGPAAPTISVTQFDKVAEFEFVTHILPEPSIATQRGPDSTVVAFWKPPLFVIVVVPTIEVGETAVGTVEVPLLANSTTA